MREGLAVKKMVIGVGLFLSGVVLFCTDYAVRRIIESMPNTTLVSGGIPVSYPAFLLIAAGTALTLYGYRKD